MILCERRFSLPVHLCSCYLSDSKNTAWRTAPPAAALRSWGNFLCTCISIAATRTVTHTDRVAQHTPSKIVRDPYAYIWTNSVDIGLRNKSFLGITLEITRNLSIRNVKIDDKVNSDKNLSSYLISIGKGKVCKTECGIQKTSCSAFSFLEEIILLLAIYKIRFKWKFAFQSMFSKPFIGIFWTPLFLVLTLCQIGTIWQTLAPFLCLFPEPCNYLPLIVLTHSTVSDSVNYLVIVRFSNKSVTFISSFL